METINKLYFLYPAMGISYSEDINVTGKDWPTTWQAAMGIVAKRMTKAFESNMDRIIDIELSDEDISGLYDGRAILKEVYGEHYDLYYDEEAENGESWKWEEKKFPGRLELYTADFWNTLIAIYLP